MKYVFLPSLVILLLSCNTKFRAEKKLQANQSDTARINTGGNDITDEKPLEVDSLMPSGFNTDSAKYIDTSLNLSVDILYAYPTDESQSAYKQLLNRTIDTALQELRTSLQKGTKEIASDPDVHNEFYAFPLNFYQDSNIVSVRFVITFNSPGAAHSISQLKSVNYDKKLQIALSVKDYFDFKTSSDSSLIIDILDRKFSDLSEELANGNPWTFYNIGRIDFNLTKDSLSFNFSDYALGQGPSMIEYKVSKKQLISLISPSYR